MRNIRTSLICIILLLNTIYFPELIIAEDCDWPMKSRDSLGSYSVPPSCTPPYKYFEKKWEWTSDVCQNNRSIVAADDKIFCAGFAGLFCLSSETGQLLWSKNGWHHICLYNRGRLYVIKGNIGEDLKILDCIDATTGGVIWSVNSSNGLSFDPIQIQSYNNKLFILESKIVLTSELAYEPVDTQIRCIELSYGNDLWIYKNTNLEHPYINIIGIYQNRLWLFNNGIMHIRNQTERM